MEPLEKDIKSCVPLNDAPDKTLSAIHGVGKLKQSRYEDVWPEDVHAAFMEAVALYPPMGKRRLKYYRVSARENGHPLDASRAKSFGRCQLIQSYILEKTGKDRSRKQVSSHLQRLKKIHKDNPAMRPLFSDCPQSPSESCPAPQTVALSPRDTRENVSFSTSCPKSESDATVDIQNNDSGIDHSSASTPVPEAPSFNGSSYNVLDSSTNFYRHRQPPFSLPQHFISPPSQQYPANALHSFDNDYLSELHNPILSNDMIREGFRTSSSFDTSPFSRPMHRLASWLPKQGHQPDSEPTTHFSGSCVPFSSVFQSTRRWLSYDCSMDGISCNSPVIPSPQGSHAPSHPLQLISQEKCLNFGLVSDWIWPQSSDLPLGLPQGTFEEVHFTHTPPTPEYNLIYPGMMDDSPEPPSFPFESEVPEFQKGISYPYTPTSSATVFGSGSKGTSVDFPRLVVPESCEILGPPLVIRPTPVYPVSYVHPKTRFESNGRASSLPL